MRVYDSVRPLLFRLNAELAHGLTLMALSPLRALRYVPQYDERLATTVAGISFPSPVGMAAGFDKNAKAAGKMLSFGFGWIEVGTVTPRPQPGNAGPRLFRLEDDEGVINRFGFNSDGHAAVEQRLAKRARHPGIVGVNVGANKDSEDRIGDYVKGVACFSKCASYITINISSPNTPGLRDLQSQRFLSTLIERVTAARERHGGPPLFLKVSPDLTDSEIGVVSDAAVRGGIDALIISNTTTSRPPTLKSPCAHEPGGLSGKPLKELSLRVLKRFRSEVGTSIPLIGAGGISSAEDAYERIRAGASLIQLYSALVYQGPRLITEINSGLVSMLERDRMDSLADAVGADASQDEALTEAA